MSFELPKLSYAYDALEPHIDARTMEIHHSKHHAGYTAKFNAALEAASLDSSDLTGLMTSMDMNNAALRNNGGGYYNHCLFWEVMSPNGGGEATGAVGEAINTAFGSFENFKTEFAKVGNEFLIKIQGKDVKSKVIDEPAFDSNNDRLKS